MNLKADANDGDMDDDTLAYSEASGIKPETPPIDESDLTEFYSPPTATEASPAAETNHNSLDPDTPRSLGPWKLIKKLGSGGMGVVYLAQRTDGLEQIAAIKLVRPEIGGHKMLTRFQAEGNALARLSHPGIARIYDSGLSPEGRPYLVMEYIPDGKLSEKIDQISDLNALLELFKKILQAVSYLHGHGIIHRDIKPSNILLSKADELTQPKIIDFGLVKALDSGAEEYSLTLSGQPIGTPLYMSPEQHEGLNVDVRTDIYALGVILYQLLTQKLPFSAPPTAHDFASAPSRLLAQQPTCKRLKGDLDNIVLKAIATDKDQRYGSAQELLDDILNFQAHRTVTATAPSKTYVLKKFLRRNRLQTLLSIAAFLVIATVATLVANNWINRSIRESAQYVNALRNAQELALSAAPSLARELLNTTPVRLRGFETRYLYGLAQGSTAITNLGDYAIFLESIADPTMSSPPLLMGGLHPQIYQNGELQPLPQQPESILYWIDSKKQRAIFWSGPLHGHFELFALAEDGLVKNSLWKGKGKYFAGNTPLFDPVSGYLILAEGFLPRPQSEKSSEQIRQPQITWVLDSVDGTIKDQLPTLNLIARSQNSIYGVQPNSSKELIRYQFINGKYIEVNRERFDQPIQALIGKVSSPHLMVSTADKTYLYTGQQLLSISGAGQAKAWDEQGHRLFSIQNSMLKITNFAADSGRTLMETFIPTRLPTTGQLYTRKHQAFVIIENSLALLPPSSHAIHYHQENQTPIAVFTDSKKKSLLITLLNPGKYNSARTTSYAFMPYNGQYHKGSHPSNSEPNPTIKLAITPENVVRLIQDLQLESKYSEVIRPVMGVNEQLLFKAGVFDFEEKFKTKTPQQLKPILFAWDPKNNLHLKTPIQDDSEARSAKLWPSKKGTLRLVWGRNHSVMSIQAGSSPEVLVNLSEKENIGLLVPEYNSQRIVASGQFRSVLVEDGIINRQVLLPGNLKAGCWSSDGKRLFLLRKNFILICDPKSGSQLLRLAVPEYQGMTPPTLHYFSDPEQLVLVLGDGRVCTWQALQVDKASTTQ